MLFTTLVIPLVVGLLMQNFPSWRFVSIPLHSTMESAGAVIAFIISAIIFIMYHRDLELNHFNRASFALISMGVFDLFHAMVYPGELFVWLHSLAIFFGGILFSLVWIVDTRISKKLYYLLPALIFFLSLIVSVVSILYPSIVPQMLTNKKEFTDIANLLNMVGGVMYVVASFYFIKKYLDEEEIDSLLFAGHTMLFGSAGVLFFFSNLWDISWWFWHTLRLAAYIVSLYFMLKIFYQNMIDLESSNQEISHKNRKLTASIKMLEEYKNAIYEGSIISIGDLQGRITYVNDHLLKITGYSKSELIGQPHSILRDPATPKSTFKKMWALIENKQNFKGLIKNRKKDGSSFYAKITIVPILDEKGDIFEYLALREDVTELVKSQKELKKHFFTDSLTGLNNRFKLDEDIKEMNKPHIAFFNIDNFKSVNDVYGQSFGDLVIVHIANELLDLSYPLGYTLYRNHGDEFVLVAEESFDNFLKQTKLIQSSISNSKIKIDDIELNIDLSVGVSDSSNDLIRADIAIKEAKNKNRSFVIYHENLNIHKLFEKNIEWSGKIKDALNQDRIEIVLQPIHANRTQRILKYEALVRLIDTTGMLISPFEFLDVAKRTKLYAQLTRRVIKKAFRVLQESNKELSINICAEDILDDETREYILNTIKESQHANRLVLELVESEGIESFSEIRLFIDEVKAYGVKIAIDDFGTGYSNFEYLLKLDANFIKIDGSMIKDIDVDFNKYNIVETIVDFAKKNNMQVIAEFVSSETIQKKVLELGIEFSQGYYIGKPKLWREIR
jgi:PAS domain S-box-containing protein/diguanylate cyclase (GGDEF)-like protein